jgi:hypothetical protein
MPDLRTCHCGKEFTAYGDEWVLCDSCYCQVLINRKRQGVKEEKTPEDFKTKASGAETGE